MLLKVYIPILYQNVEYHLRLSQLLSSHSTKTRNNDDHQQLTKIDQKHEHTFRKKTRRHNANLTRLQNHNKSKRASHPFCKKHSFWHHSKPTLCAILRHPTHQCWGLGYWKIYKSFMWSKLHHHTWQKQRFLGLDFL